MTMYIIESTSISVIRFYVVYSKEIHHRVLVW